MAAAPPEASLQALVITLIFLQLMTYLNNSPAKNHATPPAKTTTATVSKPVSPVVVALVLILVVVLMVILCLKLLYSVMLSSSKVPVAVCPFAVVVTSDVVKPLGPTLVPGLGVRRYCFTSRLGQYLFVKVTNIH